MMDRIQGSYPKHKPEYTQAETIIQNELDPGFSQLALYSVDLLIDLMFVDLNNIFTDLFVLKWYGNWML